MRLARIVPWGVLLLVACQGEERPPGPVRLAVGLVPTADLVTARPWSEADASFTVEPASEAGAFWVHAPIPASTWKPLPGVPGAWSARRPFFGGGPGILPRSPRLVGAEQEYQLAHWRIVDPDALGPGYFKIVGPMVLATTRDPAGPGDATLQEYVELGVNLDGTSRVRTDGRGGDGFLLAPGFPRELGLPSSGPATLVFRSRTFGHGEPLLLELRLDTGWTHVETLEPAVHGLDVNHRVELPSLSGKERLTFSVSGPPAVSAVLAPVLAPHASATPPPDRPDLLIFLADTYRADNLEAYSGTPGIAPRADRLAREGILFTQAVAPSPWTLPSHAALFAARCPPELGVETPRDALPREVTTLAEVLLAAGYRTAAVTDDAFVSPEYGLAQGFETFDARRREPTDALLAVEAALERDDGRPLFLFVHSYRAHHPYVVSPETAARIGERIGLRSDLRPEDFATVPESLPSWSPGLDLPPEQRQRMRDYEALYRGASADLDVLFGTCLERWHARGRPERTVFTSDHGEAFWEHGIAEHGNGVWSEHLRIPLILAGTDLAPRRIDSRASLIDLPRTLCGLLGIEPDAGWSGVDLLAPQAERAVLSFQCDLHGNRSSLALHVGNRKLVLTDDREAREHQLVGAYDLEDDPGELHDRSDAPWVRELLNAHAAAVDSARSSKVRAESASPSPDALEELGRLGYGGR